MCFFFPSFLNKDDILLVVLSCTFTKCHGQILYQYIRARIFSVTVQILSSLIPVSFDLFFSHLPRLSLGVICCLKVAPDGCSWMSYLDLLVFLYQLSVASPPASVASVRTTGQRHQHLHSQHLFQSQHCV